MRLKQYLNENKNAQQYMSDLLLEKHNKVAIPTIQGFEAYMEDDNWMAWETNDPEDPRILTMPFFKNDKTMSIQIVTDYGENVQHRQAPFSIIWDKNEDFDNYLKIMKKIINKYK